MSTCTHAIRPLVQGVDTFCEKRGQVAATAMSQSSEDSIMSYLRHYKDVKQKWKSPESEKGEGVCSLSLNRELK